MKEKYQIHYVLEPFSFEAGAQVIRPAQRVMSETWRGRGKGTCIDLALLLASCIENIRLQPLIIFVKEKWPYQHAFLGCWKEVAERFRPIVTEIKHINNEQIVFLESTGVTDRWGKKLTYDEAVKKASEQFCQERFLFAVDIAGARQTVVPLQFPMSPGAIQILREAEAMARKEKSAKLETGHLLLSLLLDEDKEINEIMEGAGADLALLESKIAESRSVPAIPAKDGTAPRSTINYRRVLEDARLIASDTGTGFTEKIHFFYALLLSQSESVDFIFNQISSDRKQAKSIFDKRFGWTGEIVQSYFETT